MNVMKQRPCASLVLCSILLSSSACEQKAASPAGPPAASAASLPPAGAAEPLHAKISEEDAEWIFRKTLQRHRDLLSTPGRCGFVSSWTSYEYTNYRTEGRLLARSYPALAERLSLEVLNDPESPASDRFYAWYVLGILAPRTSPSLEEFLEERAAYADFDNPFDQDSAITCLADRRLDERRLALFRAQARRGNRAALNILTEVEDPQAVALFREMTGWDEDLPYPLGGMSEYAEHMLKRIAILQSRDWEDRIARIITGPPPEDFYLDIHWALAVARRRNMPGLRAALEKRLAPSREVVRPGPYPDSFRDGDYDHVLAAYASSGGALTSDEEKHLWEYGFRGDSEERLLQLLALRSRFGY